MHLCLATIKHSVVLYCIVSVDYTVCIRGLIYSRSMMILKELAGSVLVPFMHI